MAVGSFSAGLSGLMAHSTYLSVIGNNLANINTIGFKASAVRFTDLVSQRIGGTSLNPMQVGLGVATGSISPIFSQGSIDNSRESTNVALQGNGFFVVRNTDDGLAYTRAGDFSLNNAGQLVTQDGWTVQGYSQIDPTTGKVVTTGQISDLVIPLGSLREPRATTEFGTVTNLDANAPVGTAFTTSVEIYDSLGTEHIVTVTFTNTGPGGWNYVIEVPGEDVAGGTPGTPTQIANGALQFDANGTLDAATGVNGGAPADVAIVSPAWSNGAAPSNLTWALLDPNGDPMLSGFDSPSATASKTQNGSQAGQISDITITPDGSIIAAIGSGQSVVVGQLAIANFNNPKGLIKLGQNRFAESEAAGLRNIGIAGTGGRGTIIGQALEGSNVDIALEFTQMILAQRGYQANAKTITVSDELLVDTLQLKR